MSFDKETKWARGLVNLNQTREERQAKYHLARSLGASPVNAQRARDWHKPKIERAFGVSKV